EGGVDRGLLGKLQYAWPYASDPGEPHLHNGDDPDARVPRRLLPGALRAPRELRADGQYGRDGERKDQDLEGLRHVRARSRRFTRDSNSEHPCPWHARSNGSDNVTVQRFGSGQEQALVPVGRRSELSEIERFLVAPEPGGLLVLCGEPGIGKSTLWEAGVDVARAQGFVILCARASEAEAQLSFVGLADLLEAVDSAVWRDVPAPQRRALEVAIGRAEPADSGLELFAVSAALLGVLRLLSGRGPVLVVVDDLPWLDGGSAGALAVAARRLAGEDVRYLVARRGGPSSELERVVDPRGVVRLAVGPLSIGAINRLLIDRLGRSLPRRAVREVFETSRGNPLF